MIIEFTKEESYSVIQALMEYRRKNERATLLKRKHEYEQKEFKNSDSALNKCFDAERKNSK